MHTNGHTSLPKLRQELREVRAQRAVLQEQLRTEHARRQLLRESYWTGYPYSGWLPLDYPQSAFDPMSAPGPWVLVGGYRGARKGGQSWPVLRTETDADRQREMARWLADTDRYCKGTLRRLTNYSIRTGFKYQVLPRKDVDQEAGNKIADVVQKVIDGFLVREKDHSPRLERWAETEKEIFQRVVRDGEVFLRTFVQSDGSLELRFIEPEQIRQPPGTDEDFTWGIRTEPDDIQTTLGYAVAPDPVEPMEYDEVPAKEVFALKRNTDVTVKRGVSDFFSCREAFDLSCKLVRNLQTGAGNQAAISWIEEYKLLGGAGIAAGVRASNDQLQPSAVHPVTGKPYNFQMFEPGLIIKTGAGKEYKPPPPANNAAPHVSIVQAGLRSISQLWDMPEYMMTADASNANFASTMVAGAPFVIAIESEQQKFANFFLDILWYVVKVAADAGLILNGMTRKEIAANVDIHATAPQVTNVDRMQNAQINEIRLRNGVMSKQTWRAEDGLDDDRELQNLREEPVTNVESGGASGAGFLPRLMPQGTDPQLSRQAQESLRGRIVKLLESAEAGNIPATAIVHYQAAGPAPGVDVGKGIVARMRNGRRIL